MTAPAQPLPRSGRGRPGRGASDSTDEFAYEAVSRGQPAAAREAAVDAYDGAGHHTSGHFTVGHSDTRHSDTGHYDAGHYDAGPYDLAGHQDTAGHHDPAGYYDTAVYADAHDQGAVYPDDGYPGFEDGGPEQETAGYEGAGYEGAEYQGGEYQRAGYEGGGYEAGEHTGYGSAADEAVGRGEPVLAGTGAAARDRAGAARSAAPRATVVPGGAGADTAYPAGPRTGRATRSTRSGGARPSMATAVGTTTAPLLDSPLRPRVRPGLSTLRPPARSTAPRGPFVVLLLVLMGAGLLSLLLLNTALMENAFHADELERESAALTRQEQELSLQLDQLSDPGQLAARATQLGMVPGGVPEYLPEDAPLPAGARVITRDAGRGMLVVVVPNPAAAAPATDPAPAGAAAADAAATGATAAAQSEGTGQATSPGAAPAGGAPAADAAAPPTSAPADGLSGGEAGAGQ